MAAAMSIDAFRAVFATGAVRAWTDWDALTDDNTTVTLRAITTAEDLGDCFTVWYRNGTSPAHFIDQHAHRSTVRDEVALLGWEPADEALLSTPHVLPVLHVGDGKVLLLDGNHRAVALAGAGGSVRVVLAVLHGPADPMIFPDLIHEHAKAADPEVWDTLVATIRAKFGTAVSDVA